MHVNTKNDIHYVFDIRGIIVLILEYLSLNKFKCETFLESINKSIYVFSDIYIESLPSEKIYNSRYLCNVDSIADLQNYKKLFQVRFSNKFNEIVIKQSKEQSNLYLPPCVDIVSVVGNKVYDFSATHIKKLLIENNTVFNMSFQVNNTLLPKTLESIHVYFDRLEYLSNPVYTFDLKYLPQTIKHIKIQLPDANQIKILSLPEKLEYLCLINNTMGTIFNTLVIRCKFPTTFKYFKFNGTQYSPKSFNLKYYLHWSSVISGSFAVGYFIGKLLGIILFGS